MWSAEADAIVRAAGHEARAFGNDYVGTEHILLSLSRHANLAAAFLQSFAIPISIVGLSSAVKSVEGTRGRMLFADIHLTRNAEQLVLDAQGAARRASREFVGSEHLLWAMVSNRECMAARALAKRCNLDWLEEQLKKAF